MESEKQKSCTLSKAQLERYELELALRKLGEQQEHLNPSRLLTVRFYFVFYSLK